jgi:hypothetical protein
MGKHGVGGGYKARIAARKRGKMSIEEKAEIERLCVEMKDPTPGKIAEQMNRMPSIINWYMLTHGLITRTPGHAPARYVRKGKTIHPYTTEQDAFIERLRAEGKIYREIGELVTKEFGIERSGHSVQVRMLQLAASPS